MLERFRPKRTQGSGDLSQQRRTQRIYFLKNFWLQEDSVWPVNKVELPKKSKPLPLQPRLDEEGQIRCDSRLRYAEFLSYVAGFTKILPRRHQVTKLIVKKYHEDGNNASGTNRTSASLSTQIWIVAGRDEIRKWEKECNECCRRKAKAAKQIMALLN